MGVLEIDYASPEFQFILSQAYFQVLINKYTPAYSSPREDCVYVNVFLQAMVKMTELLIFQVAFPARQLIRRWFRHRRGDPINADERHFKVHFHPLFLQITPLFTFPFGEH